MTQLWIETSVQWVRWIPSVFGLSFGESITMLDTATEVEWSITICIRGLSWNLNPLKSTFLESVIAKAVGLFRNWDKRENHKYTLDGHATICNKLPRKEIIRNKIIKAYMAMPPFITLTVNCASSIDWEPINSVKVYPNLTLIIIAHPIWWFLRCNHFTVYL